MIAYCGHGGFILGQTTWEEGQPWLRPAAARYIEENLPDTPAVFEWGSGSSTIWMARIGCQKIITLELNHDWAMEVLKRLMSEGINEKVTLCDYSVLNPPNLQGYADHILQYPDESFDFVLVDGRNRCRCLANALSKVKIGGLLCLDNSERSEYTNAVALITDWSGYSWGDEGWMTTVWTRQKGEIQHVVFPNEDA